MTIKAAQLFSAFFTGAMLLIALSIIPYWESLSPQDFKAWFSSNAHFLGNIMIPLSILTVIVCVIALIANWRGPNRKLLALATLSIACTFFLYAIVFSELNNFLLGNSELELSVEIALARWKFWHWVRTGLGFIASIACSFAS